MKKTLSSVAALFLFGSFAATSGAFASTHDGAEIAENVNGQTVERLEMSEEEKTRRQEECVTRWEHCEDRCWKSNKKGSELRACLADCKASLAGCMGKIP
jgi:hypothetical protein